MSRRPSFFFYVYYFAFLEWGDFERPFLWILDVEDWLLLLGTNPFFYKPPFFGPNFVGSPSCDTSSVIEGFELDCLLIIDSVSSVLLAPFSSTDLIQKNKVNTMVSRSYRRKICETVKL